MSMMLILIKISGSLRKNLKSNLMLNLHNGRKHRSIQDSENNCSYSNSREKIPVEAGSTPTSAMSSTVTTSSTVQSSDFREDAELVPAGVHRSWMDQNQLCGSDKD